MKYAHLELGTYKSKKISFIQLWFRQIFFDEINEIGVTLHLKNDSTFILSESGSISYGYYKLKNDSLILYCEKEISRKDTNEVYKYEVPDRIPYYIVDNKTLYYKDKEKSKLYYFKDKERKTKVVKYYYIYYYLVKSDLD
jgi:hypothetical protein